MPERLPRQLRILYELSRVVQTGPYSLLEVVERICTEVKKDFGFATVRVLVDDGERALLDAALHERRAVVRDEPVARRQDPEVDSAPSVDRRSRKARRPRIRRACCSPV